MAPDNEETGCEPKIPCYPGRTRYTIEKGELAVPHRSTRWRFAPLAAPFWMVVSSSASRCRQLAPTNSSVTGWDRRVLEGPWNNNRSSGTPGSALQPQCSRSGKTEVFFRLSNLASVRSSLMKTWVVSVHLRRVCSLSL